MSLDQQNNAAVPDFKSHRTEIIEQFVQAGIDLFCREVPEGEYKHKYKETNVSYWVYFTSQEVGIPLSRTEFNEIVAKVYAAATSVIYDDHYGLTVGKLRESLEGLPDNMPVFYQRMEDSLFEKNGWTTTKFVWEMSKARDSHTVEDGYAQDYEGDVEFVKNNPSEHYDIKEINGVNYVRNFSSYINAHSGWKVTNDEGKSAFVINAHY